MPRVTLTSGSSYMAHGRIFRNGLPQTVTSETELAYFEANAAFEVSEDAEADAEAQALAEAQADALDAEMAALNAEAEAEAADHAPADPAPAKKGASK